VSARGRPILVTGSHRSGTTWIGKTLALAPGVAYVHEPFNPVTPPGISAAPFDRFFAYVTAENEARYAPALERTLAFRYDWRAQGRALRGPREAARAARDAAAFARARATRARPLVKDPVAIFSAEWLARRFGMDVVLAVRNPLAFVSSLKRLGWTHRFETWAADEALLRDRLGGFAAEVRAFAETPRDVVSQGILLWRIFHRTLDRYRSAHPEWLVVRHEDLAREPLPRFAGLYELLGLELRPAARRAIERSSGAGNPVEARSRHDVRLDSAASLGNWRTRLTAEEAERVREETRETARLFYRDDEW
jgi:hypothetical protein